MKSNLSKFPETNGAPLRIGNGIDGFIDELQIRSVVLSWGRLKTRWIP